MSIKIYDQNKFTLPSYQSESSSIRGSAKSGLKELIVNQSPYAFDLKNLNKKLLRAYKSDLHQLVALANKYDLKINITGLRCQKINRCCTWFSDHRWDPTEDFEQIARALSSSTRTNQKEIIVEIHY